MQCRNVILQTFWLNTPGLGLYMSLDSELAIPTRACHSFSGNVGLGSLTAAPRLERHNSYKASPNADNPKAAGLSIAALRVRANKCGQSLVQSHLGGTNTEKICL